MTTQCPKCHSENTDTASFCSVCGTQLVALKDIPSVTKTLERPIQRQTVGTIFAERYEILEELGRGGMGEVYRVKDQKLNEEMALKLLRPEIAFDESTIERFRNELKLARKISHMNVCRMFDFNEEEGTPYITMEYIAGEDLKSLIKKEGKLHEKDALHIAKQVCEGLVVAHKLGVVHRDLKPQNIMIDENVHTKIMDFGIARSVEAKGITEAGVIIGTPDYISPEQAEGEEADHRSDIYSLGVILYEMVTGTVPFRGDTALSVALKHKAQLPQDPKKLNTDVSESLSRLILICMEKDRERRYQTAEALHNDLQNIEEGLPLGTKIKPRRLTLAQTLIRNKLFIPVSIVALAVVALVIWQPWSKKAPTPLPSNKPFLAVVYFENDTGDEGLDHWRKALAELLITDIHQSKYIDVLTGDRLFTLLRELDILEAKSYSSEDLRKIAVQAGANHILRGNYTKAGDSFRIDAMVQDASTSEIIGSDRVEGTGEQSFFSMVDELTRRVKTHFNLSEEQIANDLDRDVGEITTSSPEAFNYFLEAIQAQIKGDLRESIQLLQKAVAIDPEFASAYRMMGQNYYNSGYVAECKKCLQKAFELIDRVSERERYQILGSFYQTSEKTLDKAIEAWTNLLEIYPDDRVGISNIGWRYLTLEEWDKAIERYRVDHEITLQTKRGYSPHPTWQLARCYMAKGLYAEATEVLEEYLSRVAEKPSIFQYLTCCYLCQGMYDLAEVTAEKALSLFPSNRGIIRTYGDFFHLKGDLERAEKEYQKLFKSEGKSWPYVGRQKLATLHLLKGQFERAKEQANKGAKLAEELGDTIDKAYFLLQSAYIHLKSENPVDALKELDKSWKIALRIDHPNDIYWQRHTLFLKGLTLVKQKSIDKAITTADELKELIENGMCRKHWRLYYNLLGMIELDKGNHSDAIDYFNKAISYLSSQFHTFSLAESHALFIEPLALAYYKSGDIDKALAEYEKITKLTSGRLYYGDIYAKSFYMLGKIYEEKNFKGKAIEHYEKFLDLWKDADPGIAEVEDARKSLAGLKASH